MAFLQNAVYRFNAIPIEIPIQFFTDNERPTFSFIWEKKTRILKKSE